jgi:cytochrome P450
MYIPGPLLEYVRYLPTREYRGFRSWLDNIREFSKGLIKQSLTKGDRNDIMSALLRANGASEPKNKMPHNEMVDQIACVIMEISIYCGALSLIHQIQHFS